MVLFIMKKEVVLTFESANDQTDWCEHSMKAVDHEHSFNNNFQENEIMCITFL